MKLLEESEPCLLSSLMALQADELNVELLRVSRSALLPLNPQGHFSLYLKTLRNLIWGQLWYFHDLMGR